MTAPRRPRAERSRPSPALVLVRSDESASKTLIARAHTARERSRQLVARARDLVPLYTCDRCGFTIRSSRESRIDDGAACPDCGH